MSDGAAERQIWLVRHGETAWSRAGQHTGRTDIALTELGRAQATAIGRRLAGHDFALVLTSPLGRAADTAAIAGFPDARRDPDLLEWDYGELEGRTTPQIRETWPGWTIWDGPWPAAETVEEVGARADRVLARCLDPGVQGDTLVFSHGHLLRILAARWLHEPARRGRIFALGTATLSILGWEREHPVIETWNEGCHLG